MGRFESGKVVSWLSRITLQARGVMSIQNEIVSRERSGMEPGIGDQRSADRFKSRTTEIPIYWIAEAPFGVLGSASGSYRGELLAFPREDGEGLQLLCGDEFIFCCITRDRSLRIVDVGLADHDDARGKFEADVVP